MVWRGVCWIVGGGCSNGSDDRGAGLRDCVGSCGYVTSAAGRCYSVGMSCCVHYLGLWRSPSPQAVQYFSFIF